MNENVNNTETEKTEELTKEDLREMIKLTELEAEEEKRSIPKPETARLTYSAYSDMRPVKSSVYAPIGIFNYIGMLLLFDIPVIGFIASLIYTCAAKKLARKRFAAAVLILKVIGLVLLSAFVILFWENLSGVYRDFMEEFGTRV